MNYLVTILWALLTLGAFAFGRDPGAHAFHHAAATLQPMDTHSGGPTAPSTPAPTTTPQGGGTI